MRKLPDLQFYLDRFRGEIGQAYVADMFRFWGYEVKEVPQGYNPDFDLFVTKKGTPKAFTVEVKHDYRMTETGNAILEHDGLDHSKADYLAYCAGEPIKFIYLMPLDEARKLAHSHPNIREVGKLKSSKPNYAAIVSESILLESIPKICKLEVPQKSLITNQ